LKRVEGAKEINERTMEETNEKETIRNSPPPPRPVSVHFLSLRTPGFTTISNKRRKKIKLTRQFKHGNY